MKILIRHIMFLIGLLSLFTSFLFFGRDQGTYMILLLSGLAMTGISYLTILFGKGTKKSKVIWTLVLLISLVVEQFSEPLLIKTSFFIYVQTNHDDLEEINDLLIGHNGTLQIYSDTIASNDIELTAKETDRLMELKKNVDAYIIAKGTTDVYYGLWGFLDVRHGVWFSIHGDIPETALNCRLLTDKWYY